MPVNFISVEGSMNEKLENTYTTTWEVVGTGTFGPIEAIAAVGVNLYDSYNVNTEYDTTALCKSRVATPKTDDKGFQDLHQYVVTLTYGRVEVTDDNPFNEPVKTGVSFNSVDEPVDYDIYQAAITNSAGEPYAEAVTRARPQCTVSYTRNEASYDLAASIYYTSTVNLYPWNGVPKGCAMLVNRSATQEFNQNYGFYWAVSYEFAINLNGFKKKILNQGLRKIDYTPPILTPCVDENWNPVTTPVLLLDNGKQAPKNSVPKFREYEVYNYADFSVFGF